MGRKAQTYPPCKQLSTTDGIEWKYNKKKPSMSHAHLNQPHKLYIQLFDFQTKSIIDPPYSKEQGQRKMQRSPVETSGTLQIISHVVTLSTGKLRVAPQHTSSIVD